MIQSNTKTVEVTFLLLCWADDSQCREHVEIDIVNKIGARGEVRIKNSMNQVGLTLQNVLLKPADDGETEREKISLQDTGYIIFIAATAGVIGLFSGLILVGLAVMKARSGQQFYLGTSRHEDLQPITSSEDVTIIQGNIQLYSIQDIQTLVWNFPHFFFFFFPV